jgi:hypothetical protein
MPEHLSQGNGNVYFPNDVDNVDNTADLTVTTRAEGHGREANKRQDNIAQAM